MANEIISGSWPPNCSDPCVSGATLRTIYQISDSPLPSGTTSGIMVKMTSSTTCSASDWVDICEVCAGVSTAGDYRIVNNGNGTFSAYNGAALIGTWSQTGPAGDTGATGPTGDTGATGTAGIQGLPGTDGLSAYQIWLNAGNSGTESDFLASLGGTASSVTVDATSNPALTINAATQVLNLDLTTAGSYSNTTSGLTATSPQAAIDEIATADRPFRLAGIASIGGAGTQPDSADSVGVDSPVQHRGTVLIGGVDGDTPSEQLHVMGDIRVDDAIPELVFNRDGAAAAVGQMRIRHDQPTGHTNSTLQSVHSIGPTTFLTDVSVVSELDLQGNLANTLALDVPSNRSTRTWHSLDEPSGTYSTLPPVIPMGPWHTARFAMNIDD